MMDLDDAYLDRGVAGLKPGRLFHFGNYFGTIHKIIESQERSPGENFLFVADLHASLDASQPATSRQQIRKLVRDCIHLGVDPTKTWIFLQSDVPEVLLLMLRLSAMSPLLPPHSQQGVSPLEALYDNLMCADVLGLRASTVNVGGDLQRRVTICNRFATVMNDRLGRPVFPQVFRPTVEPSVDAVAGVDGKRMSLSARNYIPVLPASDDEVDEAIERIEIQERPARSRRERSKRLAGSLYANLAALVAPMEELTAACRDFDAGWLDSAGAKDLLRGWTRSAFGEARRRQREERLSDRLIDDILDDGRIRARNEYRETLLELDP